MPPSVLISRENNKRREIEPGSKQAQWPRFSGEGKPDKRKETEKGKRINSIRKHCFVHIEAKNVVERIIRWDTRKTRAKVAAKDQWQYSAQSTMISKTNGKRASNLTQIHWPPKSRGRRCIGVSEKGKTQKQQNPNKT